jgi:hypothetical protein
VGKSYNLPHLRKETLRPTKRREQTGHRSKRKASTPTPQQFHIPNQFVRWVKGRTVDLSEATPYYKRLWDIYRPLVSAWVEEQRPYRYELHPSLLKSLSLRLCAVQNEGPSTVVTGVCGAAFELGHIDEVTPGHLNDGTPWPVLHPEAEELLELFGAQFQGKPISESWKRLGASPVPDLEAITLQESEKGKWESRRNPNNERPLIQVAPFYNSDKKELPKLTIEIEGEPVCLLMKAFGRQQNPSENDVDSQDAAKLWAALLHWSSVSIGLSRAEGGRPKLDQGRRAAFMHDHLGLSWSKVSHKLCRLRHRHGAACRENFRKQAEQYWKRLRRSIQP